MSFSSIGFANAAEQIRAQRGRTHGARRVGLALALCLAASASVLAQTPPDLARYAGQYVYAGSRDDGIEIVEKAVDKAMADQNMVMRALAKKGFSDHFADKILIEVPAGKIGLKVGDLDKYTQDIGKTVTVKGKDGKQGRLTYRFDGGAIVSTLLGEDSSSVRTVLTLAADGKTLQREVKITSSQLNKPISYRLQYKRGK